MTPQEKIDDYREEIEALLAALETTAPNILSTLDEAIATAAAVEASLEIARPDGGVLRIAHDPDASAE
jgi:hypothetical protein